LLRDWGRWGIALAITITFFFSGMWHGADWKFVVFGLLHGLALVYEVFTKKARKKISKKLPAFLYEKSSILLTFLFASFTWIFFRADSMSDSFLIIRHIFTLYDKVPFSFPVIDLADHAEFGRLAGLICIVMTACMFIVESRLSVTLSELTDRPVRDYIFCTFILTMIILLGVFHNNSFIYFQF